MRQLRWLVGAGLAIPLLGTGFVFGASEFALRDVPEVPAFERPIPTDSVSLKRGQHVARTRGCFGCHGQQLEGRVFTEWPWVKRGVAPNLAAFARQHPPEILERSIRHGVGHDGRALWSMPSYNYTRLSDSDLASLIGFLRSAPVRPSSLPSPSMGLRARWELVRGRQSHLADWVLDVPPLQHQDSQDESLARGEYLAHTTCNECHGLDLRGDIQPDFATPDLAILAAYPFQAFTRLMKEGTTVDNRAAPGLMGVVAEDRFAYFTDQELEDLYRYLRTLSVPASE